MTDERIVPAPGDTSTVSHTVLVDGTALPATFEVLSIVTEKEVNRISWARIEIRDGDAAAEDFPLSNGDELIPGREIEIKIGYASQEETVFKGLIVKHRIQVRSQTGSSLIVECRDEAVKMTIGRKSRYFLEKKDSDVMGELIGDHGVTADVTATSAVHSELIQVHATDWDFLLARADANGYVVLVDDGTVTAQPPDVSGSAALSILYGDTIFELDAEIDARHQYDSVRAYAWDQAQQKVADEDGTAPPRYPQGDLSESALAATIGLTELELRHSGQLNTEELQAWAGAHLVKSSLGKIVGTAKVTGYGEAKLGQMIELSGVGNRFNGKAYVAGVRHELVRGSWYTDLQFGLPPRWSGTQPDVVDPAAAGLLPGIHGLQIGVTTKLEGDPEGEDRIQVRLPLIDDAAEGTWARWSAPDAGSDRGVFFRPEIEDEVVIGFLNGDPRDPIVLGMLHSSKHVSPIPLSDDNHEKAIVTREGLRVHFDDEKKVITIETPGGNSIVLSDDGESITLTSQHSDTITMDSDGVTVDASKITLKAAQEITMEAGTDLKGESGTSLELKAGTQFKAEGSAGANLETSAIATIKGSMVMIN